MFDHWSHLMRTLLLVLCLHAFASAYLLEHCSIARCCEGPRSHGHLATFGAANYLARSRLLLLCDGEGSWSQQTLQGPARSHEPPSNICVTVLSVNMQHALRATQSKVCMQYAQNSERYVRQIHIYVHASVVMMQKCTHVYTYVCLNDY